MFPDTRTLVLAMAISTSFLVLASTTLWRQQRHEVGGLGEWSLGYLLISLWAAIVVIFPFMLRSWAPALFSSGLLIVSFLLIYEGVRRFLVLPKRFWLSGGLLGCAVFGLLLAALMDSVVLRYFVTASLLLVAYLLILRELWLSKLHVVTRSVFALLALIVSAVFTLRVVTIVGGDHQVGVYVTTHLQMMVNLVFALFVPMIGTSLVLMVNERVQAQLHQLAMRDSLTGVFNRRAFLLAAEAELERSRRYGTAMGLVQVDLDYFKRVNDTYGHQAGDRLLIDFATRVTALLRTSDVFGRMGGEEFILLLPQTGQEETLHVAERIRASLEAADIQPGYTASFGVATAVGGAPAIESLIATADAALYRAKANGRNRVEFTPPP